MIPVHDQNHCKSRGFSIADSSGYGFGVLLQVSAASISSTLTIEMMLGTLRRIADTSCSDVLLRRTLQHRDLRNRWP
jgi:hypothetical protein